MIRTVLRSTIHEATVTQADLHYVGSITIDADLMAASGLCEGEQVQVVDVTNGARVVTYAITGEAGSGVIGMNGAAARLVHPGDQVTITGFVAIGDDEPVDPHVVRVDAQNRPAGASPDPAPAVASRPVASVGAP